MKKIIPILLYMLFIFSYSPNVFADTLSNAIEAEACGDSESENCTGICTQTNNVITIATTGNDDGGVTDADSGNVKNFCNEKPDQYRITFYKAGLCKTDILDVTGSSNPTIAPNCYNFFVEEGKAITLQHDTATGAVTQSENLITGDLFFELGTYNYAYVIVDNHLEIKHQQTYSENMTGDSVNSDGMSWSSGLTCWTNGTVTTYTNANGSQRGYEGSAGAREVKSWAESSRDPRHLAMICGETEDANPQFNIEIIENMAEDPGTENSNFEAISVTGYQSIPGSSDTAAGKLLQDDNLTTATSHLNAARIFYPIKFANPLIVTPDIKKFTVSFDVSGSVSLDFDTDGSNNLINVKAGADPFTIKFSAE